MYCEENLGVIIPNLSVWYASVVNWVSLVEIMVRILTRRNRDKIPIARSNEPDMLLKRIRKVQFGIYRTQIRPCDHDIAGYDDSGNGFWLVYGPFHLWSAAGNHGSCIDWLDEYKYHMHDSLQGHLIQEIGHWLQAKRLLISVWPIYSIRIAAGNRGSWIASSSDNVTKFNPLCNSDKQTIPWATCNSCLSHVGCLWWCNLF